MSYLYLLLALSFAVSALGWIYFIYFFSLGYGILCSTSPNSFIINISTKWMVFPLTFCFNNITM